jgi:hypothetical protein
MNVAIELHLLFNRNNTIFIEEKKIFLFEMFNYEMTIDIVNVSFLIEIEHNNIMFQ